MTGALDDKLQKKVCSFCQWQAMDGSNSALMNGNVRGRVHSKALFSSSKNDTPPLSMTPNGCEVSTNKHEKKVRSVVLPSDTNKNEALQDSIKSDNPNRELVCSPKGPGSSVNRYVAIENHNGYNNKIASTIQSLAAG